MTTFLIFFLVNLFRAILRLVCLLIAIAYFTLAERKLMAAVQRRVGPNVVGPFGLLQPLADGLKLAGKELTIPAQASRRIFLSVAMSVLLFALVAWAVIPFGMFDHSEFLNNSTVAKTLVLTDTYVSEPFNRKVFLRYLRDIHAAAGTPIIGVDESDESDFDDYVLNFTIRPILGRFMGCPPAI
jgi:hypothetical protein